MPKHILAHLNVENDALLLLIVMDKEEKFVEIH
jgi:hypothetical protein